jgi:hypothetical protein
MAGQFHPFPFPTRFSLCALPMLVYLVRHAQAVPEEENSRRPLSVRGRKTVRQIAAFFRACGALLCLESTGTGWQIRWHFSPELLPAKAGR